MDDITITDWIYICAAVGRVSNPLDVDLYEKMISKLSIFELHKADELAKEMEFSGDKS